MRALPAPLSDSGSRAAALSWPEAPSSAPLVWARGPGRPGKSAVPGRPHQPGSPQSRPELRFPLLALGWGKPRLLGVASN